MSDNHDFSDLPEERRFLYSVYMQLADGLIRFRDQLLPLCLKSVWEEVLQI